MKLQNETKPQNLQDIVNRIWKHFITDNNPQCIAINIYASSCTYRESESGNGCAIGCMLPDSVVEKIVGRLMYTGIHGLFNSVPSVVDWFSVALSNGVTVVHLRELQRFHDGKFSILRENLTEFCHEHNLNIPGEKVET